MEITYTNLHGKPITEQQIDATEIYIKVFKENNRLRKKEFYDNNQLFNELYYIELGESHQELLDLNLESIGILEIEEIDIYYVSYKSFSYYNNLLENIGFEIVYVSTGKTILTQDLDLQTSQPLYNKTYKYYEDEAGYEFRFDYYHTGELAFIIVSNDEISFYEQFRASELNIIPHFEWWNQYSSYYLNAEPAVPNFIIT